jgi:hypothetical protein
VASNANVSVLGNGGINDKITARDLQSLGNEQVVAMFPHLHCYPHEGWQRIGNILAYFASIAL